MDLLTLGAAFLAGILTILSPCILPILPIVLLSSLVGAVIGGIGLKLLAKDSDTQIPFGPFLAIAGWIWFLFGPELSALYWGLMLPPGASAP